MKILSVFDGKSYAINEKGVKWWNMKDVNSHIKSVEKLRECKLKIKAYAVEEKSGARMFVIANEKGDIIYESQRIEHIGCFIDKIGIYESTKTGGDYE